MFKASFEIGPDPGELLQKTLSVKNYSQVGVLMDTNTVEHCYPQFKAKLSPHATIIIPAGEEHKNLKTCEWVWSELTRHQFDRHAVLIIVGGGVLGDLGGFCAATYKRGIDFLLMPTTLLAQVDASIGGKLGIDFQHLKNHIGLFSEPVSTLISPDFLKTLPERELRSGFAEIIKHCLISDPEKWKMLIRKNLADQHWTDLIKHSVEFKASIIKNDPKEAGLRKILNFGHTIGHALESYFLDKGNRLFHGEAIAAGMIIESHISRQKHLLDEAALIEISDYIRKIFGIMEPLPAWESLNPLLLQDKKNKGNTIRMALLKGIGSAVWDISVSEEEVKKALDFYRQLH